MNIDNHLLPSTHHQPITTEEKPDHLILIICHSGQHDVPPTKNHI